MLENVPEIQEKSILEMVTGSSPVVQAVLITLIILSVWSWAITIAKTLYFRRAKSDSREFNRIFWETRNLARIDDSTRRLDASPLTRVFISGYREFNHVLQGGRDGEARYSEGSENLRTIEGALKRAEIDEMRRLERGITFLASVASAAPFIGLFGTVWGIMNAFHGLSSVKSSTIQAVAPGISEALVATAIGLAAAIPAAVAYNYFAVAVKEFKQSLAAFSTEFVTIARQQFVR